MQDLLPHFNFCVVDLETTGLNPDDGSGIIEVGGVKIVDGEIEERFEQLADPGHSIPEQITRITGLDDDDIDGADPSEQVLEDFLEFVDDSIFVAHNARFDISFLHAYSPEPLDLPYIDTLRMARQLLDTDKHSLVYLAKELNLTLTNPHRAAEDAHAAAELFLNLTERMTDPEDYFRCKLPEPILRKAPFKVPRPNIDTGSSEPLPEVPPTEWILYGLYELDTTLGVNKLAKILSGSDSQAVQKYVNLNAYGKLSRYTQDEIKEAIERSLEEEFVHRTGEPYPVLNLTDKGIERLRESSI